MDTHKTAFCLVILVIFNVHTNCLSLGLNEDHRVGDRDDETWTMVQKNGNQFVVNDQPFYVNGFNTYWLMVFAVDESTKGKVTQLFQQASSVGLTVCRTWAFNDGQWRALQKKPSVYDEDVFKVAIKVDMENDPWTMVQKSGNQFVVNDQPFYVNGFNTYWLMVFAADESTRGKVTQIFQQASSVGLTVCRTWAFNDGQWHALQKKPSVYDEDIFKALDFVVSEAKRFKIRLILSLTNNWDSYGGKPQYVRWGNEAGLNVTNDDDFFSHPTLRSYYKSNVKVVLNRVNTITNITYKDDPTIFAWELINEPRCSSDPSGDKLQEWIEEMAVYVKSIDPKHLLEIGLEGFYGASTPNKVEYNPNTNAQQLGTDFIRNHQVPSVDFASVHIYADSWISASISNAHISFIKSWMRSHIDDAEKYLGMPVVFSEFGVSTKDPGYTTSFRNHLISTVYNTVLDSAMKGGSGGGSLVWQVFPDGTEYMDDGYAIVLSESPSTSKIISRHSTRLAVFNLLSKRKSHLGYKKKHDFEGSHHNDKLNRNSQANINEKLGISCIKWPIKKRIAQILALYKYCWSMTRECLWFRCKKDLRVYPF